MILKDTMKLKEILSNSDIVTIHTPLTQETRGMIDKHFINYLKKDSILINVSRGAIVQDNSIILNALRENKISGYGTDVFQVNHLIKMMNFSIYVRQGLLYPIKL